MPFIYFGGGSDTMIITLILFGVVILSMVVQSRVTGTFRKYSQVPDRSGLTGAEVARRILDENGLSDVNIEHSPGGFLSDHYDPRSRVLRLSREVYQGSNIAALGVAAHECGHAIQHGEHYGAFKLRQALAPTAGIGSQAGMLLFIVGLIMSWPPLTYAGIGLYALIVIFQLITLPVELNASSRALSILESGGYMDWEEAGGAKKVLSAAAMTYLMSALVGILSLLRLISLANDRR